MDLTPEINSGITRLLRERFIFSEEVARVLTLALNSDDNVLLWGPAGHGKSEMVQAALSVVTGGAPVYTHSFGEGMTEDRLWGGIDLAAMRERHELLNLPAQSFLPHELAVFEELLDAPPVVLLALKDTLSAHELRKGNQRFPMTTKVIIAITNKDPREMSALGPAAHALMERFPYQLKVEWPSYTSMDYLQLFELVEERFDGPPIGRMNIYLAELLADIGASGEVVSPRLAQQALKTVKRSAALRGAHAVDRVDFVDLRFVPGMAQSARNIEADLNHLIEREAAREHILAAEARYEEFVRQMSRLRQRRDAHGMLDIGAELHRFIDEVASLRVTDDFAARRRDLRNNVEAIANEAQRLTVEYSTGAAPRVNY